jgi:hypothetical protein
VARLIDGAAEAPLLLVVLARRQIMARKPSRSSGKKSKVSLIVTDDKEVKVRARPGKMQIVQVEHVTPDLKKARRVGSRLCGYGSNICIAIVDVAE